MNARLALLCATVASCSHPRSATCDLDRDAIAGWLVTAKFGEPGDPASRQSQRWHNELGRVAFLLDNAGVTEWCTARDRTVDNACWTHAGDARPDCQTARNDLEDIAIGGPLCDYELKRFAIEWLVAADRLRPGERGYQAEVNQYAARVAEIPGDRICTEIGGLFIRCYRDAADPRCERVLDHVRYYLPKDGE